MIPYRLSLSLHFIQKTSIYLYILTIYAIFADILSRKPQI